MQSEKMMRRITDEINNGSLINGELFISADVKQIVKWRSHIYSGCGRAAETLDSEYKKNTHYTKWLHPEPAIASVMDSAYQKSIEASGAEEGDFDLRGLCSSIKGDFRKIAQCVFSGIEHPLLNGFWVFYRAGRIPSAWLEVPGTFEEIFDIPREEAIKLVEPAEKAAEEAIAAVDRAREELQSELAATVGMPSERVVKYLLALDGHTKSYLRILFTENELSEVQISGVWREMLTAQWAHQAIPWGKLWNETVAKALPAVMERLEKYCLGLAVMTRSDAPPALIYIFSYEDNFWKGGKGYVFFVGAPAIGSEDTLDEEARSKFNRLPAELKTLYRTVHDGWCTSGNHGGPLPVSQLFFLSTLLSDKEAFRR
ncbi:MAG: hypothetical protein C0478_18300, partial [Planctomyces sp.]|nr:hypothetical protein [Planctomyces sp.]